MKKLFITLAAAAIAMLAANAEEKEKVYDFGEITSINAGFSPAIAAWIPNIIFFFIAWFLYKKAPR